MFPLEHKQGDHKKDIEFVHQPIANGKSLRLDLPFCIVRDPLHFYIEKNDRFTGDLRLIQRERLEMRSREASQKNFPRFN